MIAQDKNVFVAAAGWKHKMACLVGVNLSGCLERCCIAVVGFLGNFGGVGEGIFTWVGGVEVGGRFEFRRWFLFGRLLFWFGGGCIFLLLVQMTFHCCFGLWWMLSESFVRQSWETCNTVVF